jgi:hypothetical protein
MGKVRVGRFNMNWAGIIVALIFALLHMGNFDAYWLEKSKSVVAPIISSGIQYRQ